MQYAKGQRCQEQQNSTFDETLQCEQNKYKSGKLLCFTTKRNYSQLLLNTQTCLILQSRLKESASPGCSFTPVTINPISHETSHQASSIFHSCHQRQIFFFFQKPIASIFQSNIGLKYFSDCFSLLTFILPSPVSKLRASKYRVCITTSNKKLWTVSGQFQLVDM